MRPKSVLPNSFIFIVCLTISSVLSADGRYYNSDDTIATSHPDWMSWLPDSRKLSELSIPGTHDTMSFFGGDLVETQGLPLARQLEAGIRYLDIRAVQSGNGFAIFHGCYFQDAYFEDVLRIAGEFLTAHPTETIIMRLGNTGYKDSCPVVGKIFIRTPPIGTYQDTFELYRDYRENGNFIWNPHIERNSVSSSYYPNAVAGANYRGEIPTLGEVRGKIVIMQEEGFVRYCAATGCDQRQGKGWKYPQVYNGIANSRTTLRVYKQFQYDVDYTWKIRDQANYALDFLKRTDAGSDTFDSPNTQSTSGARGADAMYINQLNGVDETDKLPLVYPYTAAGGDSVGTEGVNDIVLDKMLKLFHNFTRTTGIMPMDFPGAGIIDVIIAQNFRFRDPTKPITALAKDFEYVVNNLAYNGTEVGGDRQAEGRRNQLGNYIKNVLPDEYMHYLVWIDDLSLAGSFSPAGLYKQTDWIDTDNIFETREYSTVVFRSATGSSGRYTNEELKTFVDAEVATLTGSLTTLANTLRERLEKKFPRQHWNVVVKNGDGGFDRWAFEVNTSSYYRRIADLDYLVWGYGPACTTPTKPTSVSFTIEQDGRPLFTWDSTGNRLRYDTTIRDVFTDAIIFQDSRYENRYMPATKLDPGTYLFNVREVNLEQGCEQGGPYSQTLLLTIEAPPPNVQLTIQQISTDQYGLGSGTIDVSPAPLSQVGGNYYAPDTMVTLTATPTIRSEFSSWGGSAASCGASLTCDVTIAEGMDVQATFRPKPVLIVNTEGNGSVTRTPLGSGCPIGTALCEVYDTDDVVALTYTAGPLSSFDHWEGDPDCSDDSVIMTEDKSCTAVFARTDYQLTVSSQPGDSIASDPAGAIDCGIDCVETYPVSGGAQTVVMTATIDPSSVFVRWYGDSDCYDEDENDNNPERISVTVSNADVRCSAMSVPAGTEYALTVEKIGGGTGKVTAEATPVADSSDIDCAFAACSQIYTVNSLVQLTATAQRGSVFEGWDGHPDCVDGQVTMTDNVNCSARFTAKVLVVDGSDNNTPKENNEYGSVLNKVNGGLDHDIWMVNSPNAGDNSTDPDTGERRVEPVSSDLASYGRVVWYTGDASKDVDFSPIAGPSPAAETSLADYLDNGGCLLLSSSQYHLDRGLTSFAQTYLGVSEIIEDVGETDIAGAGDPTLGFSELGPYTFDLSIAGLNSGLSDAMVSNPNVTGSDVLFHYADGREAAVAVDNDNYRSAFFGFPFLGLAGNAQNNVMSAFMDYCAQPERDDNFETNDDFEGAADRQGPVSLKQLKIMPGNDDYFRWVSSWYADTKFSISFTHATGDLALEVYDSSHTLVATAQSGDDNEEIVISNVDAGQTYFVHVFGSNNASNRYALNISPAGPLDRDHDGVGDTNDAFPEDPMEQFDADNDGIGDKLDLDDDNDGMPDSYELLFGFNPALGDDASIDSDLDGFTNLEEFLSLTDPVDINSTPSVPAVTVFQVNTPVFAATVVEDTPPATVVEETPPATVVEETPPASGGGGGGSTGVWTLLMLLLVRCYALRKYTKQEVDLSPKG